MEIHVHFVAITEVFDHVFRPHVGFAEQKRIGLVVVNEFAHTFQIGVRFGQVFAAGALAFEQIGRGIDAQTIRAGVDPEFYDVEHGLPHFFVVIIQVGLGGVEAVPEILTPQRVEGPVGGLGVGKDDACAQIFLIGVRPDVPVAVFFVFGVAGVARCLEPGMLVGGVVGDDLDDDAQITAVGFADQGFEVIHAAISGENVTKIADVVAIVAQWGGHDRQQPDRVYTQIFQVVQLCNQPGQVAPSVAI